MGRAGDSYDVTLRINSGKAAGFSGIYFPREVPRDLPCGNIRLFHCLSVFGVQKLKRMQLRASERGLSLSLVTV